MPKDLDEDTDLPSSEQENLDDDQISDLADGAASSPAADEKPTDTLSLVRDVVAAGQEEQPAA